MEYTKKYISDKNTWEPMKKDESLFGVLPCEFRNMQGISTVTFKRNLHKRLKTIPDEPRIYNYILCLVAERNYQARRSVSAAYCQNIIIGTQR